MLELVSKYKPADDQPKAIEKLQKNLICIMKET